jgi:hypothetical protein
MGDVVDLASVRACADYINATEKFFDYSVPYVIEVYRRAGQCRRPPGWEPMPADEWRLLVQDLIRSHSRMIRAGTRMAEVTGIAFDASAFPLLPPEGADGGDGQASHS